MGCCALAHSCRSTVLHMVSWLTTRPCPASCRHLDGKSGTSGGSTGGGGGGGSSSTKEEPASTTVINYTYFDSARKDTILPAASKRQALSAADAIEMQKNASSSGGAAS